MSATSTWKIRLATLGDIPALDVLIPLSVRGLQVNDYNEAQREAAIGPVFGVDRQLIEDRTYFVAETPTGQIIGCGGWSKRQTQCGSSAGRTEPDPLIDPLTDAARIRAFFIHPNWARRGIGRSILTACEDALLAAGFNRAEYPPHSPANRFTSRLAITSRNVSTFPFPTDCPFLAFASPRTFHPQNRIEYPVARPRH